MSPTVAHPMGIIYNQWYVAGWADELNRSLASRRICGRPVVTYRRLDGEAVALEDVCAHRWMPLCFCGIEPGTTVDSVSVGTFVPPGLGSFTRTHRVLKDGFLGVLQTYHIFTPEALDRTAYTIAVGTTDPEGHFGREF